MQFGPVIPLASMRYVHHMIVYLCSNLNHTHVGASSECDNVNIDIGLCRGGGTIIAAWAVGGEVSTPRICALLKELTMILLCRILCTLRT